jgi:hypothetical protein
MVCRAILLTAICSAAAVAGCVRYGFLPGGPSADGRDGPRTDAGDAGGGLALQISPTHSVVPVGGAVTFTVEGGAPPYAFQASAGPVTCSAL